MPIPFIHYARTTMVAAIFLTLPMVAAADIMATCKPEIGKYCADVKNGKGRVAACLFANSGKLGGACAGDVKKVSNSRAVSRLVPAEVTELKGTPYEAELRAACTSDAAKLCAGVSTADERILACLYSREGQLSGDCKTTGKQVLSQIR